MGGQGYIKLHRSLLEWRWFTDSNTLKVWIYLLMMAQFTNGSWHDIALQPGQLVTSVTRISIDTGLTMQSVRTSLKKLKLTGELTSESTNTYTVVTIVNWASYQTNEETATSESTGELTGKQQTNNKRITTYKNVKKERKDNNVGSDKNVEEFFESVWLLYPKKLGKHSVGMKQKKELFRLGYDTVKKCIDRYVQQIKDNGTEPQYQKHGSTFFNSGYIDYLDNNYTQSASASAKEQTATAEEKYKRIKLPKQMTIEGANNNE